MKKLISKVADTAPIKPVAGTETFEPVAQKIDTEENTVELAPYIVEDIFNFRFHTNIYNFKENVYEIRDCNIYELLQIMVTEEKDICKSNSTMMGLVQFHDVNMDTALGVAMENNLTPTFVLNGYSYNFHNELCSGEAFTFGYLLNKPVANEKLLISIYKHLENIFKPHFYWCEVGCYESISMADVDVASNFINTIISHYIYIPVEGGIAHE